MRRMSGMGQWITPQLLNLRSRDQDTHRALKVALQPWPTLVGMKSPVEYTTRYQAGETYFRADRFSPYSHDNVQVRSAYRQDAVNRAGNDMDNQVAPARESRCTRGRSLEHCYSLIQTLLLVCPVRRS